MNDDLTRVQRQIDINEWFDNLKCLPVSSSPNTYVDAIKDLHIRLKWALQSDFNGNTEFASKFIDNLYQVVPLFDKILSDDDQENHNDFIQTKDFLGTISSTLHTSRIFEILTKFKETRSGQDIFQNYAALLKESYFTDDDKYDNLVSCILPILIFATLLSSISEDMIPANLLKYLLTFTKHHWQCRNREHIVKNILSLIKCLCKKPMLIPMLIRNEWPHACIEWLVNKDSESGTRPSYIIDYYICLILQKLARHTSGADVLDQLDCLKAVDKGIKAMRKCHTDREYECLDVLHCMIYVLLTEADKIRRTTLLTDDRMCQAVHQIIFNIIQASRTDHFFYQCFHISELLCVLSKLFVNDDMLIKYTNETTELFDCLCHLFIHFSNVLRDETRVYRPTDDETLLSVSNILWSLSFHQCYHEKFKNNTMLMHTLSDLTASPLLCISAQTKSVPSDICSLKNAFDGILWNLKATPLSSRYISQSTCKTSDRRPLAMISYSHNDGTFCRELVESLSSYVSVWVDYKEAHDAISHSDDLWEEIARAMELATVIVVIVSKEYYDSKSCRQELSYATDALKKRVAPIYPPNQQYRANGWLGIRIAGQRYIHFGRKLFPDAIKELSSIILTDKKSVVKSSPTSVPQSEEYSSSETIPTKTVDDDNKLTILRDWTRKDIQKWFEDNHIHNDIIKLYSDRFYTGTALIVYARHLKLFYQIEYSQVLKRYKRMFHRKEFDALDFVTFADALYRLRAEYDPNSIIEDNDRQLSSRVKGVKEKRI